MTRERFLELCSEFVEIIRSGTLEQASQFLSAHYQEFCESTEGQTAITFFESVLIEIQNRIDPIEASNKLTAAIAAIENSEVKDTKGN